MIDVLPKEAITQTVLERHDALLETCPLFWDVVLPKEASEWIDYLGMSYKEVLGGYISLEVLSIEKAKEIVSVWNQIVEKART